MLRESQIRNTQHILPGLAYKKFVLRIYYYKAFTPETAIAVLQWNLQYNLHMVFFQPVIRL